MAKLSIETCVNALHESAITRRDSFQKEVAVALSIFAVTGAANHAAKTSVKEAYAAAGYDCIHYADQDYKSVNRYINNAAALFRKIGPDTVIGWIAGKNESAIFTAVIEALRPLELCTQRDIERLCNPLYFAAKQAAPVVVPIKPLPDILRGPLDPQYVREALNNRRASDAPSVRKITTDHLELAVPPETPRDELIAMATRLLALSDQMRQAA